MEKRIDNIVIPDRKQMPAAQPAATSSMEDTLEEIRLILHRMDRRDHWRTVWGTVRAMIALVPMFFFVASMWYVYAYGDQLIEQIAGAAASKAASMTTGKVMGSSGTGVGDIQEYIRQKLNLPSSYETR